MDITFIRTNPDTVKLNQQKRYLKEETVDVILQLDEEWRKLQYATDKLRNIKKNSSASFKSAASIETVLLTYNYTIDNLINDLSDNKHKFTDLTKNQLKDIGKHIDITIDTNTNKLKLLLKERDDLMSTIGNVLNENAIISNNEDNNKVIYETVSQLNLETKNINKKLDHIKLGKLLDIVDTENGIKIAGNRGYFLTGMGVKLNMALISYAMDFLIAKDYRLMQTPHIVNKDLMSQITQLSEYEETLYKLDGYDKFLIATSEQPLTGYFNKKLIDKSSLPIKFGGLSECYRKESGRHGHQTLGIFRVHQFEKVEQFCVTEPNKSWEMFNDMINISKDFYDTLGLDYRVINIVSGALNNAASLKYDIECFFPGSKFYGEVVSCTNCLDYFSKRLNTKIKETGEYVHMLNCTLMANTRVLCCIMETYQEEDGMKIPDVLQKYMNCDKIYFKN